MPADKKRNLDRATRSLQLCYFILVIVLCGCTSMENCAPVVDAWHDPAAITSRYRVQKNDTIYSVAWGFDLDYRDLVAANNLSPPYRLYPGQTLSMKVKRPVCQENPEPDSCCSPTTFAIKNFNLPSSTYQDLTPRTHLPAAEVELDMPEPKTHSKTLVGEPFILPEIELKSERYTQPPKTLPAQSCDNNLEVNSRETVASNQARIVGCLKPGRWQWPAVGSVVKPFLLQAGGNKGIDITGHLGDPVRAVAPGKVVYSGSGLRGYGNLIIIKHSDNYLSAYAYNKRRLVKEGDTVKAGCEIAKMGQNDLGQVMLHFEIRRNGKPVDPLLYL